MGEMKVQSGESTFNHRTNHGGRDNRLQALELTIAGVRFGPQDGQQQACRLADPS